ncbi:MAG: TonB family protein [Candidatus Eremiobacteraeota bacterium]|nr:TonB family protein [Candidatus Eremiobacteraeota bacterium]
MATKQKKDSSFITTGERLRNFLAWAFLISVAIHFVLVPFFPTFKHSSEDEQVEKVSVTKKIKVKVPTPPPPTPTPKPTIPPPSTPQPKITHPQPQLKVNIPKTSNNSSQNGPTEQQYTAPKTGSENGVPNGNVASAAPSENTPGPPRNQCANPNAEATVTNPYQPEYPEQAKELGLGPVTVLVEVKLSATGSVTGVSILQSSNNSSIDQEALRAARESTYTAKMENCQPVAGDYSFRANFDPGS